MSIHKLYKLRSKLQTQLKKSLTKVFNTIFQRVQIKSLLDNIHQRHGRTVNDASESKSLSHKHREITNLFLVLQFSDFLYKNDNNSLIHLNGYSYNKKLLQIFMTANLDIMKPFPILLCLRRHFVFTNILKRLNNKI